MTTHSTLFQMVTPLPATLPCIVWSVRDNPSRIRNALTPAETVGKNNF